MLTIFDVTSILRRWRVQQSRPAPSHGAVHVMGRERPSDRRRHAPKRPLCGPYALQDASEAPAPPGENCEVPIALGLLLTCRHSCQGKPLPIA